MPTNRKSLARHIRMLMLARLSDTYGVEFREGTDKTRRELGIHLASPETYELERAAETAHRDGFETVYIYTQEEF